MTDVLGYETYAVHSTDWGSLVAWQLYGNFNQTVRAFHTSFIPKVPYNREELAERNITLKPEEELPLDVFIEWQRTGTGYFQLLSTKVRFYPEDRLAEQQRLTSRSSQTPYR